MTFLSDHFSLEEVSQSSIASRLGIDNSVPNDVMAAVRNTARNMEKVRGALMNKPISVDSWYRCLALNRELKSADTSQHLRGEAVDFICPAFGTPTEIAKYLLTVQPVIRWDQLILEHTWIHISFNSNPAGLQRGQVLSLLSNDKYSIGLTDPTGLPVA